jgi:hypothetical protein
MQVFNRLLSGTFDVLLYPFRDLPPIVGLAVMCVLSAVAMLLVFKLTSDQHGLAVAKRRMHAAILEIRLFSDDPRAILSAQRDILRQSFRYMCLTLAPMLWMMIPLLLVIVQLQFRYGYGGLDVGREAIVKVKLSADRASDEPPPLQLDASSGIAVETPLLWIPSLGEADWRIRASQPGTYRLQVRLGDEAVDKTVLVSNSVVRRSLVRPSGGLLGQVLYPVEPPLPDGPVESITVGYPEVEVSLLGWETHWFVVFFILTIVAAFALRGLLGVTI